MKDIAITTYIDDNAKLIKEFDWLHKSWMMTESDKVSDIMAFVHPKVTLPYDDITVIPLQPLTETDITWQNYPFINSSYFLCTKKSEILKDYDYVLKTDHDCFLTPYFPLLRPRLPMFGIGLFATDSSVVRRLTDIAVKWGIMPFFNNVGSSFMMRSEQALQYSSTHFEYCKRMRQDEFKDGKGKWPGWYFGVLTMYAGQLAANAFFGCNMTMGGLDVHSMAGDKISRQDYHIHAFHTYDDFSKFKWHDGGYNTLDFTLLDKELVNEYCLYIAGVNK